MAEVRIDGVLYVPVSEAHIDAPKVIDALCRQWYGDNWQENYPEGPSALRVVVSDSFARDEGESVTDFVSRVISDG